MHKNGWISALRYPKWNEKNYNNLQNVRQVVFCYFSFCRAQMHMKREREETIFALKLNLFYHSHIFRDRIMFRLICCFNLLEECEELRDYHAPMAQIGPDLFKAFFLFCRINKTDKNMEKDVDAKTQAAVIDTTNTTNVSTPVALPIVIKIEMPKDHVKENNDNKRAGGVDDVNKPTKSRLCQLLPVLLFLVTFATVLTLLIIYMDPSSEYLKLLFSCKLCVGFWWAPLINLIWWLRSIKERFKRSNLANGKN